MDHCRLTARELDTVYASGQGGLGLGIIPGLIRDLRGPGGACWYAFALVLLGNVGLQIAVTREGCAGLHTLSGFYFLLQQGSVALFQSGLFSNQEAALDKFGGIVVGIVSAGYGLSATLWSTAYATIFKENFRLYLHGTTLIFGVSSLVGAWAIPRLLADL